MNIYKPYVADKTNGTASAWLDVRTTEVRDNIL